jgi:CelD/BcsL family acetyltransferase involved in cellulose biosynthesis
MLKTDIIRELGEIDPEQWESLLEHCPHSTVFQSREWIGSWWRTFRGPGRRLHIVTAYEGARLVGLAPLYAQPRRAFRVVRDELRFPADGHADYQLFPAWGGSPRIVTALLDTVREQVRDDVAAVLSEIPQHTPLALCLEKERPGGRLTGLRLASTTPCPRLRIRNNTDEVRAILRKDSIRRDAKRLARVGPIAVQHHTAAVGIRPLLPEFFQQHIDRWKATPYPSLFLDPNNRAFYERLVEELCPAGRLVFSVVRAGDHVVALHLGLRSRDEFIWYKPTFKMEFQRYSPGMVLLKSLIEYAQAEGCAAFDFGRGDEPFKGRFASSVDYNASFEWIPDRWHRRLGRITGGGRRLLSRARARLRAA